MQLGGADIYTWIALFLVSLTKVITWFEKKRTRNNSTLQQMQTTIDMLVEKNSELYNIITEQNNQLAEVRKENADLKQGQEKLSMQLTKVQQENAGLKKQLSALSKNKQKQ